MWNYNCAHIALMQMCFMRCYKSASRFVHEWYTLPNCGQDAQSVGKFSLHFVHQLCFSLIHIWLI